MIFYFGYSRYVRHEVYFVVEIVTQSDIVRQLGVDFFKGISCSNVNPQFLESEHGMKFFCCCCFVLKNFWRFIPYDKHSSMLHLICVIYVLGITEKNRKKKINKQANAEDSFFLSLFFLLKLDKNRLLKIFFLFLK